MTISRLAVLLAAVVGLLCLGAGSAAAHANLVATTPAQGVHVDTAPDAIVFTMDAPVQLVGGSLRVIDTQNNSVPLGNPEVTQDRTQIRAVIAGPLPDGAYLASVRAVSADTHVVAYSIRFAVGNADLGGIDPRAVAYGQAGGRWTTVIEVARALGYAGTVLSAGLLIALAFASRPTTIADAGAVRRLRATALAGAALVALGALLHLVAQGPYALGADEWEALLRLDGLGDTLSAPLGVRLLIRLVTALLLGAWVWRRRVPWRPAAVPVVAGVFIAYTFAAGGHATTGTDAGLAIASTTAHVLAMAVWMGGIVALLVGGRRPVLVERWTVLALTCLLVLVGTGVYQGVRRVYPLESLWHTEYGLLLLAKVGGVVVIVAAAFWARNWLRGRSGAPLSVRTEAAAGAAVLVLTTVLASSVPARDDYGPPLAVTTPLEHGSLTVGADTTRRGPVTVRLRPDDAARAEITAISASLSSAAAGISRLPVELSERDGVWTSSNVIVPAPAEWTLSIVVDSGTSPVVTAVRYVVW